MIPSTKRQGRPVVQVLRGLAALTAGVAAALLSAPAHAAAPGEEASSAIAPFSTAEPGTPPAAWKFTTLPKKRDTRYSIVDLAGAKVLKVETDDAYGNLVHAVHVDPSGRALLAWRWRVDKLIDSADLKSRGGDDSAAKLCVFFAFDADKLSIGERTRLALARSTTGEAVPPETLCYVWDAKLPAGTTLDNAFTRRIRFIVVESGSAKQGQWVAERRDVAADYLRAFADEAGGKVPVISGIAVSADSDNTHGQGLAYFGDISLAP